MKKALIITGSILAGLLVISSLLFWLVLPNVIDLNNYKADLQKIVEDETGIILDVENAQLITTPLFSVGVKLNNINVQLPDESDIFTVESIKTRVALPSIFLLTVKVSNCEIQAPKISLDVINGKNLEIIEYIETLLNKQEKVLAKGTLPQEKEDSWFNPEWIRIKIPAINIYNYNVQINDVKNNHKLTLKGDKLTLAYANNKVKVKTYAELYSDNDKNITANLNLNTFVPKATKLDEEDDEQVRMSLPKINPVQLYRDYDLKANVDAKLKIRARRNGTIVSYGHFNAEDITFELSKLRLPKSYIRVKTKGTRIFTDTNLYIANNTKINLLGFIKYGKNPKMDLAIKTDKIYFNDIVILCKSALDNIRIKNDLITLKGAGYLQADTKIKTNFKKLKSEGYILVNNGTITNATNNYGINNWNMKADFSENMLRISNGKLYVNSAKIIINGVIDEKSVANINIQAKHIKLPETFRAFAPSAVKRAYDVASGKVDFNIYINGALHKAVTIVKLTQKNLVVFDKASNLKIASKLATIDLKMDTKNLLGMLSVKGVTAYIPQTKSAVSIPAILVKIADDDIIMEDMVVRINKNSSLKTSLKITEYETKPLITAYSEGKLHTTDLIQLMGKEASAFVSSTGALPIKLSFIGDEKRQALKLSLSADSKNYLTPIAIQELQGKDTELRTTILFKKNRTKIKDTGLAIKTLKESTNKNEGPETVYEPVISVDGTLTENHINVLKIKTNKDLHGSLVAFKNSHLELASKMLIFGDMAAPRIRGYFHVNNISIPELFINANKLALTFKSHSVDVMTDRLNINGSDLKLNTEISLVPSDIVHINHLTLNSNQLNVDKLMAVSDTMMKKIPQSPASATTSAQTNIPVSLKNGHIDIKNLKTGNILVQNIYSNILLHNNIFTLRHFRANAFDGNIRGNILVNLVNSALDIKLKGDSINVDKALVTTAGLKDSLSGSLGFETDIKLKGATYEEQVKGLDGDIMFAINNGQFGPFAKLENFILAENIRNSQFFQTALGDVINKIATVDTTHFDNLNGVIHMKDGVANIETIASQGNTLCLNVFGDMDILANTLDMKVRTRLASNVSDLLGPIANVNPVNLVKKTPGVNIAMAKAFTLFTEAATPEEMATIPELLGDANDNNATKFQIVLNGDLAKPLTLVKSFKWLATQADINNAEAYTSTLPVSDDPTAVTVAPKKSFRERL